MNPDLAVIHQLTLEIYFMIFQRQIVILFISLIAWCRKWTEGNGAQTLACSCQASSTSISSLPSKLKINFWASSTFTLPILTRNSYSVFLDSWYACSRHWRIRMLKSSKKWKTSLKKRNKVWARVNSSVKSGKQCSGLTEPASQPLSIWRKEYQGTLKVHVIWWKKIRSTYLATISKCRLVLTKKAPRLRLR